MSFANLKSKSMDVSKLVSAANEMNGGGTEKKSYGDDRFWKPTVDESGNGYAVIRFLPAGEGQELPWVRYWDHFFKGPSGQWYIEKSLTTIGQNDPVSELNSRLWNSGIEDDKEIARKQKRRLHYVSNILVVNDPSNPANNGKVFLYDFGKKIFDKIMDKMQPEFPGEEPVNPFDFWNGADFQLKIRNVAGYRNYDKSEFKAPSALFEADEVRLEATYNQQFDLSEFSNPTTFKSYDELKTRLDYVLGIRGVPKTQDPEIVAEEEEFERERRGESAPTFTPNFNSEETTSSSLSEEDDDTLSYFQRLADG